MLLRDRFVVLGQLLAVILYGMGLIAPLTPSPGEPCISLVDAAVFWVLPVNLCLLGVGFHPGFALKVLSLGFATAIAASGWIMSSGFVEWPVGAAPSMCTTRVDSQPESR